MAMKWYSIIGRWMRQLTCPHPDRVLQMIYREPLAYTRRAQYYCPDCKRLWESCHMPEGI
jgi:hypothetical protein